MMKLFITSTFEVYIQILILMNYLYIKKNTLHDWYCLSINLEKENAVYDRIFFVVYYFLKVKSTQYICSPSSLIMLHNKWISPQLPLSLYITIFPFSLITSSVSPLSLIYHYPLSPPLTIAHRPPYSTQGRQESEQSGVIQHLILGSGVTSGGDDETGGRSL